MLSRTFVCLSFLLSFLFSPLQSESADYVIVGVGTSGAVLAKMLSDDGKNSVIAIHNGKDLTEAPVIKFSRNVVKSVGATLSGLPPFAEEGLTTPQQYADGGMRTWEISLPAGGASAINAGIYCRATNQLFAQWEAIAGPLWSVKRLLKLSKKLENYHGKTTNPAARGHHGPIDVRQVARPSIIGQKFTKAIIAATGFPFVLDYNDPNTPIGVSSQTQYTQKGPNGILRVSSITAFLDHLLLPCESSEDSRQLKVLFESTVLRVLFEGNKAIGVEYIENGQRDLFCSESTSVKTVYANKGVIITAGLFSSPLLLHSGIGPASLLNSLNIPVIFNNPNVGQGLADQISVPVIFSTNPADFPFRNINSLFEMISWLPPPAENGSLGDPSSQRKVRIAPLFVEVPGIAPTLVDLIQPNSRGSISINSNDPLSPPVIDYGLLSDSTDLILLQNTFRTYVKSINQAVQRIDPYYQLISPDPAILDDLPALTAFIKANVNSERHYQSHCRMAPLDQGGVVDSTGHVYGVENLIVADDSIVPLVMDGSPMSSAYLIAANIAHILLNE